MAVLQTASPVSLPETLCAMTAPDPVFGGRYRPTWRGIALWAAVALGLTTGVAWLFRPRVPEPEPTVTLAEVIRLDGRLVLRTDTNRVFTGWLVEHYPNGGLKSRSRVVNGVLNGVSEGWYMDGRLQVREHFADGISEGLRVTWHVNGTTQSLATVVGGRIHGRFLRWREDGTLSEEMMMERGQPEGVSRAYYPSGFLKTEARLRAGQLVEQRSWKDGQMPAAPGSPGVVTTRTGEGF